MKELDGIRTSYVGNPLIRGELKCCIISNVGVNIPQWRKDLTLAPRWQDVDGVKSGRISWEEFRQNYLDKVLSKKNPEEVYYKYKGWYLLCCEKDDTFCHRKILAEWLASYGFDVKEGLF